MAQPIDFSSEESIPTIGASAYLQIDAWPSAEERQEKVVQPLDVMLRSAGIGRVERVLEKDGSSRHFLTGVVSYSDSIVVELNNFRTDFRRLESALRELGISASIYYALADGRDAMSGVRQSPRTG